MNQWLAAVVLAACVTGCGSAATTALDPDDVPVPQRPVVAREQFQQAMTAMRKHDAADSWSAGACTDVLEHFELAGKLFELDVPKSELAKKSLRSTRYNTALVHQRCGAPAKATALLEALVSEDATFSEARLRLALLRYEQSHKLDGAIDELDRIVVDGKFKSVEALVQLAALQMRRAGAAKDENGYDDLDRARINIQRALAVEDRYMPAHNQLALYYLQVASGRESEPALRVADEESVAPADTASLELAALVCAQAMQKDPKYAPIHNTAGLVQARMGDLSAAVRAFDNARKLDARFYEAHMNVAAVNLQFRGFLPAQHAYETALELRPKSYDAHLGLALAIRGQIGSKGGDDAKLLARSEKLLASAKELDRERPEAYFNEAILVAEFHARGLPPAQAKPYLLKAKALFSEFTSRAQGKQQYATALARAKERMSDIDQTLEFTDG